MANQNLKLVKYVKLLMTADNNIEDFYLESLKGSSIHTQISYLTSLKSLFKETKKNNVQNITKADFYKILQSEWFNKLGGDTQKLHIIHFQIYFRFSGKKELAKLCHPEKYNGANKEINKNDLINRVELQHILKHSNNLKLRTLIMVLYEGALRKGELLGIKFRHIKFENGYINLFIESSKTQGRNLPLEESIPYLREWINNNNFNPDDYVFKYTNSASLNVILQTLAKKLDNEYDKWNGKRLFPHLFRHSRLTELALTTLNEPQLKRFAGWSKRSQMAEKYFHLDDDDIKKILLGKSKKPELEPFESKKCPHCNGENPKENVLCWKCNKSLDRTKEFIGKQNQIEDLKTEVNEMKQILISMNKFIMAQYEGTVLDAERESKPLGTPEPERTTYKNSDLKEFKEAIERLENINVFEGV